MSTLVILVLLLNIFLNINCENPASPCPYTFGYKQVDGIYYGFIRLIPNPGESIHRLEIKMSVATQILNGYVGKIERIVNINSKRKCALYFQIYFPSSDVLPYIELITHNNKILCSGPPAKGEFVTTLALEHTTTYECEDDDDSPSQSLSQRQQTAITTTTTTTRRPKPKPKPRPNTTTQRTTTEPNLSRTDFDDILSNPKIKKLNSMCGIPTKTTSLVVNGKPSTRGAFPWLAAIFYLTNFTCGGSLISSKHVVTAAHCIILTNPQSIDDFIVFLGKHEINNKHEPGSVRCYTQNIITHPDYHEDNLELGDADLAIIIIREIQFSAYIRPICLFYKPIDIDIFAGQIATLAGWGKDELGNTTSEVRQTAVKIISPLKCNSSHVEYGNIKRSFCAGGVNTGPCNGDSGGGLFLRYSGQQFYLRGVVSMSLTDQYHNSGCNVAEYALYTDVCRFTDWINKILLNT